MHAYIPKIKFLGKTIYPVDFFGNQARYRGQPLNRICQSEQRKDASIIMRVQRKQNTHTAKDLFAGSYLGREKLR